MQVLERTISIGDGDWFAGLMKRPGEVVMVFLRPGAKVLLNTKDFYPEGAYRLPSGGIHKGESPEETLVREAREETGLSAGIERKIAEIHWTFEHGDARGEFTSHIFLIAETREKPVVQDPDERITAFMEVGICELGEIADQLRNLTGRWHDWGVFRAYPHEVAFRELCARHV